MITQIDEDSINLSKSRAHVLQGEAHWGEDLTPTLVPRKVRFVTSDRLPSLSTWPNVLVGC